MHRSVQIAAATKKTSAALPTVVADCAAKLYQAALDA
jgi:hypothetical protein